MRDENDLETEDLLAMWDEGEDVVVRRFVVRIGAESSWSQLGDAQLQWLASANSTMAPQPLNPLSVRVDSPSETL